MRFLCDMGVSTGVVTWLRQLGHDAKHLRDEGLHRLPNGEIFDKAGAEQRIVLTFDLDFGEILALSGSTVVSVILFRLNNTTTPFVIGRLSNVLRDAAHALDDGAIVVVEDGRHRVRRLPLGR
jgi:predicted nuclease of predicted toxin-antitoxin system